LPLLPFYYALPADACLRRQLRAAMPSLLFCFDCRFVICADITIGLHTASIWPLLSMMLMPPPRFFFSHAAAR